jgi:hypothetical protein
VDRVPDFSKLPNDVLEIFIEMMDPFLHDVLVGALEGFKKGLSIRSHKVITSFGLSQRFRNRKKI